MTAPAALSRLGEFVAARSSRASVLARSVMGLTEPGDRVLRRQLLTGMAGQAGTDGSVRGSLVATASAVLELASLGQPEAERVRMIDWLATRQGAPGAYHEGCTVARHQHRACEHFLDGFFAAAPPARRAAPVALANGKEFRVESQARFAASCLALEAMLRSGRKDAPKVERHLDSFVALVDEWTEESDYFSVDLMFSEVPRLASAPLRWRPALDAVLDLLAARQQADGTWPGAEFFHALDALSRIEAAAGRPFLARALETLLRRQREDGSFGSVAEDERALIAARTLIAVGRGSGN
jgi:hypothetical protein